MIYYFHSLDEFYWNPLNFSFSLGFLVVFFFSVLKVCEFLGLLPSRMSFLTKYTDSWVSLNIS